MFGYGLFVLSLFSQRALQQMALSFQRLDAVVEHLLHSFELETQPLELGCVQLIRLLSIGVTEPAERFQGTHFSQNSAKRRLEEKICMFAARADIKTARENELYALHRLTSLE